MQPYWHKIPCEDQKSVLKFLKMTIGEFTTKYQQPKWCGYSGGLDGEYGCWSLLIPGRVTSIEFCNECELCRNRA